jgi:hypothetical protein
METPMKIALALSLFVPSMALAQSTLSSDLSAIIDGRTLLGPTVDCFDPKTTPACGDINRSFCQDLARNEGRLSDSSGVINVGKSRKSQLSEVELANINDLIRSLAYLPAELQEAIRKNIKNLEDLVNTENDSEKWYRDISQTRNKIALNVRDLAKKKAEISLREKLPRGQRSTREDVNAERDLQEKNLLGLISKAKMESSPHWGKVQGVLAQVKQDITAVIETLPLTQAEKEERLRKVNTTNLSTPFGVRIGGVMGRIIEQDCRTNMINAMYMPFDGSLTVCAGFLNAYQSESSLYFAIAHELAHAFNLNHIQLENSSPRWTGYYQKLLETNGNIPCDQLERMKTEERNKDQYQCGTDSYNKFLGCLTGLTAETLPIESPYKDVSAFEKVNFCAITDRSQGLAYMNPNEFADRNFSRLFSGSQMEFTGLPMESARGMLTPAYEIVQEKRCHPEKSCEEVFALAKARVQMGSFSPACTKISLRGQENESDWYAHKAMLLKMRRTTDIRERREMAAASMAFFCPFKYMRAPSEKQLNELMKEAEKIESENSGGHSHHASNDDRIEAIMTEEMSSLLQCTRPKNAAEGKASYQGCRL